MARMRKSTRNEDGTVTHHGICGHDFPGSGKRGRPPRNCPKCSAKLAKEAQAEKKATKKEKKAPAKKATKKAEKKAPAKKATKAKRPGIEAVSRPVAAEREVPAEATTVDLFPNTTDADAGTHTVETETLV